MTLRGLPVEQPDRIVGFNLGDRPLNASYRDIDDWRAARSFADLAAYSGSTMTTGDEGRSPTVFPGAYISANAFGLLGERPMLGRGFLPADDRPGAPAVVILGYQVWSGQYVSDPSIVGKTIRVNALPAIVVGVMPSGFRFPMVQDIWQPLGAMPRLVSDRRAVRTLSVFGRLAAGVSIRQAQAELNTIAERLAREHPDTNQDFRPVVVPYTGTSNHPIFIALFGAMGFVLLIACANVANLLLARSARRSREICIRASLGATRWRIVRQLLGESVLLALAAGALGLALSTAAVKWFSNIVEGINFPYWYSDRWTMDERVFAFVASICVATVFLFGLLPALHLSRSNLSQGLKDGGRSGTAGPGARRWTSALLIAQLAFTVVLLSGAGLMVRSLWQLFEADRIVDTRNLFRVSMRLPPAKYPGAAERLALYGKLEEQLTGLPPIASATVATAVPFIGAPQWRMAVDGAPASAGEQLLSVALIAAGTTYFDTLGLGLVRGRSFTNRDGMPGYESAIVNQRLSEMFFANENPVGRRIRLVNPNASASPVEITATIVGVAQTVRHNFFNDIDPAVYVPYRANPSPAMLLVRGRANEAAATAAVREQIRQIDPDIGVFGITPAERDKTQSRWGNTVFGTMIAVFAGVALVLAAVGLYAVTAYGVTQRTQEIGVRMALGAEASAVVWLFVRGALMPLAVGLALGLAGGFGVGRLLRSMLVLTSPTDPATFATIAFMLIVVTLVACLWPARRAADLDPVLALRTE